MPEVLSIIAGNKKFPIMVAEKARSLGRRVVAVAFTGITEPALAELADSIIWLQLGQLQAMFDFFHAEGIRQIMMAGGFSAENLASYEPDERAVKLLEQLEDFKNDSILKAISDDLESEGLSVVSVAEMLPELVAGAGILGAVSPSPELYDDLRAAWQTAKIIGQLDIGQTVVAAEKRIVALEAMEGTDATIVRGGTLSSRPAVAAKVAKPGQDMRFDLPVIGLGTMEALIKGGLRAMAVEAGFTIIFDREEVMRLADANNIALLAWNDGDLRAFGAR